MKKLIFALIAAMSITVANAQEDNRPQREGRRSFDQTEMVKRRTDDVVKKYSLSNEQAEKLLALNTKYADKIGFRMRGGNRGGRGARPAPNFGGNGGNRPEMTEEMKQNMEKMRQERQESMKKYDEELQTIMTPEQYKAYKADNEKRMREGGRRGGPRERHNQTNE